MADETPTPADAANRPSYSLVGQYIRDLSFENPGAPASIMGGSTSPQFSVGVNVGVEKQTDDIYAVEISITAKAEREKTPLFQAEMVYGGVFRIQGIPQEHMLPLLFIECPRLLFPFARQIIADATRNGGYPPLMIDPIDFAQMFQQRMAEEQAKSAVKS